MRGALSAAALCFFFGCPKDEPSEEEARLIRKLKDEQARLDAAAKQRFVVDPANKPLTDAVAAHRRPESLGIPDGVEGEWAGARVRLEEVQRMQTVSGDRVSLTTADYFVRVALHFSTTGKAVTLDLSGAELQNGEQRFSLARDAQRAAGETMEVELRKNGGAGVALYFEVPEEIFSKGLKIVLTTPDSRVELPLQ